MLGGCLLPGGVSAPRGVSAPKGGVCSQVGGVVPEHALRQTPPRGLNHRCL